MAACTLDGTPLGRHLCFLVQPKLKACFRIDVADFTWFYCSTMILTVAICLFLWEVQRMERIQAGRWEEGREAAALAAGGGVASALGRAAEPGQIPCPPSPWQVSAVLQHPAPRGLQEWA